MAVHGVGEETATLISMMIPLFQRYSLCLAEESRRITSTAEAREYCKALLAGQRTERFYAVCLDANRAVLGRRLIAEGTLGEVAAYPRTIVETALNLNAHGTPRRSSAFCHPPPGADTATAQSENGSMRTSTIPSAARDAVTECPPGTRSVLKETGRPFHAVGSAGKSLISARVASRSICCTALAYPKFASRVNIGIPPG